MPNGRQFLKRGTDVFEVTEGKERKLELPEFQSLGLNVNLIGTTPTPLEQARDVETRSFIASGGQLGQPRAAVEAGFQFDPTTGQLITPRGIGTFGAETAPTTEAITRATKTLFDRGAVTTAPLPIDTKKKEEEDAIRKKILNLQASFLEEEEARAKEEKETREKLARSRQELALGEEEESQRLAPMGVITGRQAHLRRLAAIEMQPLVDRLETLSRTRGNTREAIKLALDLQKATLPEVEKTEINQETGEVISIERDPITGTVSSKVVGNITPKPKGVKYISTSQEIAADGSKIFTGIQDDGTVVRETIAPAGTFRVAGTTPTESEIQATQIPQIERTLIASRGTDGFVDPQTYASQRLRARINPQDFDRRFKHLLNPEDKKSLGIKDLDADSLNFDDL